MFIKLKSNLVIAIIFVLMIGFVLPSSTIVTANTDETVQASATYNVNGSVIKLPESTFTNASMILHDLNSFEVKTINLNSDGSFGIGLSPGYYLIESISVNGSILYILDTFEVSSEHTNENPLQVVIEEPEINVNGSVTGDGLDLSTAFVNFRHTIEYTPYESISIGLGVQVYEFNGEYRFSTALPEGEYTVSQVNAFGKSIALSENVNVTGSETINIEATPNFKGIIENITEPIQFGYADVISDNNREYSLFFNKQGEVFAKFPDGTYQIERARLNGETTRLSDSFDVVNGSINPNLLNTEGYYVLKESPHNVTFEINSLPENLTGELLIRLHEDVNEGPYSIHDYRLNKNEQTGSYEVSATLPPGDYILESISGAREIGLYHPFNVVSTEENSTLVKVDATTNFKGIAKDYLGNVISNGQVEVIFKKTQYDSEYYRFNTTLNGEFSGKLIDGKYEIRNLRKERDSIPIYQPFEVVNGEIVSNFSLVDGMLSIQEAIPNVYGVLQGLEGYQNIWISIESVPNDMFTAPKSYGVTMTTFEVDGVEVTGFKMNLPPGEYQIREIFGDKSLALNQAFTVTSDGLFSNRIEVSTATNVDGIFLDASGNPVVHGGLSVMDVSSENNYVHYWLGTDEQGNFASQLKDGTYRIDGGSLGRNQDGEYIHIDKEFEVVDGVIPSAFLTNGEFIIQPSPPNVSGTVQIDEAGTPLSRGELIFIKLDENGAEQKHVWVQVKSDGSFSTYLAPGSYKVNEAMQHNGEWISLKEQIVTISEDGNEDLQFIPIQENVKGVAYFKPDAPAIYGGLSLSKKVQAGEEYQHYWIRTNENGEFKGFLPAGTYQIDGIAGELNGGHTYKQVDVELTVAESGDVFQNGTKVSELMIIPPTPNVTGVVTDSNGSPVRYGAIMIRENKEWPTGGTELSEDDYPKQYHIQIDQNGAYEFYLPESESGYIVEGVHANDTWVEFTNTTRIMTQEQLRNSDYFIEVINGESISHNIELPESNLTGTITNLPAERVHGLSLTRKLQEGETVSYNGYWVPVRSDGKFASNLPEGTYTVNGLSIENSFIPLDGAVQELIVPNKNIEIPFPDVNVSGTVKKEDGLPHKHVGIAILPDSNLESSERWQDMIWLHSDDKGQLQAALDFSNGQTYTIVGISTPSGWVELNQALNEPTNDLVIQEPVKNVLGSVTDPDGQSVVRGGLNITRFENGEARENMWVQVIDGHYEVALQPGSYKVTGVDTGSEWIDILVDFIVEDTSSKKTVNVATGSFLNVSGLVTEAGQPLANVWVGFVPEGEILAENIKWIQTDDTGAFSLQLPEGNYLITDVNDPSQEKWQVLTDPIEFTAINSMITVEVNLQ